VAHIHPSAVVDPRAEIADDAEIGPFCVVEADAVIGPRCVLGPHVTVKSHTRIAAECRIHAGAILGDLPQDKNFRPCRSFVEIGARCVIREGVTIHRGTAPESTTRVGQGCFLMAFSHVAHNVVLEKEVVLANGALVAGHAVIGEGAFVSGNCLIHQFTRVGRLAMLGGGCGVSKDVPPFSLVLPLARNTIVGINVVGLRRAGFDAGRRRCIQHGFRRLFASGRGLREAARELQQNAECAEVRELAEFVLSSRRGVCRWITSRSDESLPEV